MLFILGWCYIKSKSLIGFILSIFILYSLSIFLSALQLLGVFDLLDFNANRKYILSTQDELTGGFSKWVDTIPDTLHTYFGM
jgi:hypothetical protein